MVSLSRAKLHARWGLLMVSNRRMSATPTEAQAVFEGIEKKNEEIQKSIQDPVDKENGASRSVDMSLYAGGALVALIIVGAVAL